MMYRRALFVPTAILFRKKTVEEVYQKKSQREHILARPDMYIGSAETIEEDIWVIRNNKMNLRTLKWNAALYKIVDEVLVNASDNKVRDPTQSGIDVNIDDETGMVQIRNDGEGIPVEFHKEHNMWVPELIFGHLLTSSNYDDDEKRTTGGRYGFGAKLTNVFSKKFQVETVSRSSGKKFSITWMDNMAKHDGGKIEDFVEGVDKDFTRVTFWPDYQRFGLKGLDRDNMSVLKRRVYDIAGNTNDMAVTYNGLLVPVRGFTEYTKLFPNTGPQSDIHYSNDRWEVCVRLSDTTTYQHVSFVNSIATTRGGTHVKYITDQLVAYISARIASQHKDLKVTPDVIRSHLFVFVKAQIVNPSFDSQTKSTLKTAQSHFGSTCELPKSFLSQLDSNGVIDRIVESCTAKLMRGMNRDVSRSSLLMGIPKLDDAALAGTAQGSECTLILTEGDSAKALAVGGLGTIGRDRYGVFALRGKLLNVRGASVQAIAKCEEVQNLFKIMGLKIGQAYDETRQGLRYGRIMIMADQDHDGSHIKGLVVNCIHHFWPSLARQPGFLSQFITPLVKAKGEKGKLLEFYSTKDVEEFRATIPPGEKWTFKYYKGLGTSTSKEGKEYFQNLAEHKIDFTYTDSKDDKCLELAFGKSAEARRDWILQFKAGKQEGADWKQRSVTYSEFVNKELIHHSIADCERAIPSVVDGFKPGQRKIMYCCFKRNLRTSIKVAQLAGYVSEHAAYHHGEASLQSTIAGLAQDYVGANNVPLLVPDGQFGTRLQGGKDCASARYIFTRLANVARAVFHKSDDDLLDYKDDDGFPVEPQHYVPVIPMVLVNGTSGIGTGFATSIPNYNPLEIIANIRRMMKSEKLKEMTPWYLGFQGEITKVESHRYLTRGKADILSDKLIRITELPIGMWTSQYKSVLESLHEQGFVLHFVERHTDTTVFFDVFMHPEIVEEFVRRPDFMADTLRLESGVNTSNMMCFNEHGVLSLYDNANDILKEFFPIRLRYYAKRKEHLLSTLAETTRTLSSRVKFLSLVLSGELSLNKKYKDIEVELKNHKLHENPSTAKDGKPFEYLLGMRFASLTEERMVELRHELSHAEAEIARLSKETAESLWEQDLAVLEKSLTGLYVELAAERTKALEKAVTSASNSAMNSKAGQDKKVPVYRGRVPKTDTAFIKKILSLKKQFVRKSIKNQ